MFTGAMVTHCGRLSSFLSAQSERGADGRVQSAPDFAASGLPQPGTSRGRAISFPTSAAWLLGLDGGINGIPPYALLTGFVATIPIHGREKGDTLIPFFRALEVCVLGGMVLKACH